VENKYTNLTLDLAVAMGDKPAMALQRQLQSRIAGIKTEHDLFADECRRNDALFYSTSYTAFGADLWADDPNLKVDGRSHVSVNTPSVYVTVPAALQAVEPIENMVALADSDEARDDANALERVRESWRVDEMWQLKRHKAATIKELYGRTAAFVYPDAEKQYACADVVINPRNLYMGFKDDNYAELEWAAQVTLMDPSTVMERYSVEVTAKSMADGTIIPWVVGAVDAVGADIARPELNWGPARVEVWDHWFRKVGKPGKRGKQAKMETWNVIVVGNEVVREEMYDYYEGQIPYVPLFNTFLPGTPTGRSSLHDMEQLIREKMTRITAGAQMIQKATAGDYWHDYGRERPGARRRECQADPQSDGEPGTGQPLRGHRTVHRRIPIGAVPRSDRPGNGNHLRPERSSPWAGAERRPQQLKGHQCTGRQLRDPDCNAAPTVLRVGPQDVGADVQGLGEHEGRECQVPEARPEEWNAATRHHRPVSEPSRRDGDGHPSRQPRQRKALVAGAGHGRGRRGRPGAGAEHHPPREHGRHAVAGSGEPDGSAHVGPQRAAQQAPQGAAAIRLRASRSRAPLRSRARSVRQTPDNALSSQLGGDQGITPQVAGGESSPFAQGPQGAALSRPVRSPRRFSR
jgi:hypothetical protein